MLELRPTCEHCNTALPPESARAMICSFECTFCMTCATLLGGTCPNCGGGFVSRPVRPKTNWHGDNYLGKYPASTKVKHRPVDLERHKIEGTSRSPTRRRASVATRRAVIVGDYFRVGFMMNTVVQHLPPTREALLPPLTR